MSEKPLKKIGFKLEEADNYSEDIACIIKVARDCGYDISPGDALAIWGAYSEEEFCAGFLSVEGKRPGEILYALKTYGRVGGTK